MSASVGVIGLGTMGGAIARHLIDSRYRVVGCDPDSARVEELAAAGGTVAVSPAQVVSSASVIVVSLPSAEALDDVVSGTGGLLRSPERGLVVVETSTLGLAAKERARAQLEQIGSVLLDCPISGTGAQMSKKDVVVYASGDAAAIKQVAGLLECFSRAWFELGAFGNGTRLKFVANHLVAVHGAAAAEALLLARRAGLDAHLALEALVAGAGSSRMLQVRGPLMVAHEYGAAMRVDLFEKDLDLISSFARQLRTPTPLLAVASQLYLAALARGHAGKDTASVLEVLEQLAGE